MLMYVLAASGRHAIADCYKSMVNVIPEKKNIFLVYPNCYLSDEFSDEFEVKKQESFFNKGKIESKIEAIKFAYELRKDIHKYGIKKVFIFDECVWFNILLYIFTIGLNIQWYLYIHDPTSHSGEKFLIRFVRNFVFKNIVRKARIIFVSYKKAIDELVDYSKKILKKDVRVFFLPRQVELEFESIQKQVLSKTNRNAYDIIFFGRLEKYKGINILLNSIDIYKKLYKINIRVVIVGGKGTEKEVVKEYARVNNNVFFIDKYLEPKELAELIASAKITVLPYLDATGTQTVQVSNYYYKPVIANNVGCFSEYIINEKNGIIVQDMTANKLAVEMNRLLNDQELYKSMQDGMKEISEKYFDIKKFSENIYNSINND